MFATNEAELCSIARAFHNMIAIQISVAISSNVPEQI